MENSCIKIFIPKSLACTNSYSYMRGIIRYTDTNDIINIFMTKHSTNIQKLTSNLSKNENYIFGCIGQTKKSSKRFKFLSFLELSVVDTTYYLKQLIINKVIFTLSSNCIIMVYDYNKIRNSENFMEKSMQPNTFMQLHQIIQIEDQLAHIDSNENDFTEVFKKPKFLSSTMLGQHLFNSIDLMKWIFSSIIKKKQISIRQGNILMSILTDVILGYIMLNIVYQYKDNLSFTLMGILEKLVNYLNSLLRWLMGSPAGLKLNNAFNKMLGKYFSYHIQLWWLFLDVSGEKLDTILLIYRYIGYLGFTFQAAIISDMISIATFHSYCIYVYAARLFNLQVSGLTALVRLFIGRKYNPLRGVVDSCEYTNQELFVGTVAFTILLFLLPTTAMYYIVFTLFRILTLGLQYLLNKFIHWILSLPIYIVLLWLCNSPKVAGDVSIEEISNIENHPLVLKMKINKKPLLYLIKKFNPPIELRKPVVWTKVLSNLFTGKQIIYWC